MCSSDLEGKTRKEALRSLKRKVSDAIFARLQADARQAREKSPGGQPGNGSDSSATGSHPERQLFGPATPGPDTTIRPGTTAGAPPPSKPTSKKNPAGHLTTTAKRTRYLGGRRLESSRDAGLPELHIL